MAWKFNPFTGTLDIATTNPVTASALIVEDNIVVGDDGLRGVKDGGQSIDDILLMSLITIGT